MLHKGLINGTVDLVSVERVHKRHTTRRRAVADKLDPEQAGQRADLAVGPRGPAPSAPPTLQTLRLGIILIDNLAYLPFKTTSTAIQCR